MSGMFLSDDGYERVPYMMCDWSVHRNNYQCKWYM